MTKFEVNIVKVTKVEITMVEVTMAGVWPASRRSGLCLYAFVGTELFYTVHNGPQSTKSCLELSKLRSILNGQFCHAISKNIGLNVLGSKQPREILVFVILKL